MCCYTYSDKVDLKPKKVPRDTDGQYVRVSGTNHQEDLTFINIAPNLGAPKYIKQLLMDLNGEIDSHTITVGDFNILLTLIN